MIYITINQIWYYLFITILLFSSWLWTEQSYQNIGCVRQTVPIEILCYIKRKAIALITGAARVNCESKYDEACYLFDIQQFWNRNCCVPNKQQASSYLDSQFTRAALLMRAIAASSIFASASRTKCNENAHSLSGLKIISNLLNCNLST
jgi:hypothetical protein